MERTILLLPILMCLFVGVCSQNVNSTKTTPLPSKSCPGGNSCKERCRKFFETERGAVPPTCYCDPYCTQLRDCCADYIDECVTTNKTVGVVKGKVLKASQWKCYRYIDTSGTAGAWMEGTCPASFADNVTRAKCEEAAKRPVTTIIASDIRTNVPVVYCHRNWGEDCVTYRNYYCAKCNNVIHQKFWQVIWKCDIRPPEDYDQEHKFQFLAKYCKNFRIKPKSEATFIRHCYPVTSRCNHGNYDRRVQEQCENGTVGLVYDKTTMREYKNQYCLQCNGHEVNTALCGPHGFPVDVFNPRSFEILLEFGFLSTDSSIVSKSSCDATQIYDRHLEECRNVSLPDPRQSIVNKFRLKLWMNERSGESYAINDTEAFKDALVADFPLSRAGIEIISLHKEENSTAAVFDVNGIDASNETTNASKTINKLLEFEESFELSIANVTWVVFKVTRRILACINPEIYPPGTFKITGSKITINNNTLDNSTLSQVLTRNHTDVIAGSLFVCRLFAVSCAEGEALMGLKSQDYAINSNKSLLFKAAGKVYPIGGYELQGSTAWVCTNYSPDAASSAKDPKGRAKGDMVMWYFTVCGLPLSIICLGFLLATYITFKELHTLPGKNLMSLCVSLALAQFFWLLGSGDTDKKTFCSVTAMILHYLFLVSFGCMCVIAYDTKRAFPQHHAPITNSFRTSSRARLWCYLFFSWVIPLIYVALCVLFDNRGVVTIGYGSEAECWLSDPKGRMLFFGIPVAGALFFNLVAFVRTVHAIRNAKKGSKRLSMQTGNQVDEVKIYFRLVTLMGFTWFFGLGAGFIHPYLNYPFVLLTALHGVYLAMAFAVKPKVYKLYREKMTSFSSMRFMSRKNTISFVDNNSKSIPTTNDVESAL